MTDLSDSDASWEFVDKESDSETSSVIAINETELQSESISGVEADGLRGNDWCNHDEFITDSDIEACAEEPVNSNDFNASIQIPAEAPKDLFGIDSSTEGTVIASQHLEDEVALDLPELNDVLVEEEKSQSESVGCNNAESQQEKEEESEDADEKHCEFPILSTVSSASDFERLALPDAQSFSSDEESLELLENSTAGLEEVASLQETPDSTSQIHCADVRTVARTSAQAVAASIDASTGTSCVKNFQEKSDSVAFVAKQRFVLSLLMIGIGVFLGRCSVLESGMPSDRIIKVPNNNKIDIVTSETSGSPSLDGRPSMHPGSDHLHQIHNEVLLRERIEKEFERQHTHIKVLKAELHNAQTGFATQREKMTEEIEEKDQYLKQLQIEHKGTVESLMNDKEEIVERQNRMKLRIQRYRTESKRLIREVERYRKQARELELAIAQSARIRVLQQTPTAVSPLIHTLRNGDGICQASDRLKSKASMLGHRVKNQQSTIQMLEKDLERKSVALEALYKVVMTQNTVQYEVSPKNAHKICRSTTEVSVNYPHAIDRSGATEEARCFYLVNGTSFLSSSSINLLAMQSHADAHQLKRTIDNPVILFANLSIAYDVPMNESSEQHKDQNADSCAHAVSARNRIKRKLQITNKKFDHMKFWCSATNHSLVIAKRQKANMKDRLVVAKAELKQLRTEKTELNKRLLNVTMELKKTSSMKHCMKSAITNELAKINNSRIFKAASEVAEKATKASRKAWFKLEKLVKKFSQNEYHSHESSQKSTSQSPKSSGRRRKYGQREQVDNKKKEQRERNHYHKKWKKADNDDNIDKDRKRHRHGKAERLWKHHSHHKDRVRSFKSKKAVEDDETEDELSLPEFVSDHVDIAKEAGQNAIRHLVPIYEKCTQVYHDVKGQLAGKSFTDVWNSLAEFKRNTADGENDKPTEGMFGWNWETYGNITQQFWPFRLEAETETPNQEKEPEVSTDKTRKQATTLKDPQWFIHMFNQREILRKEIADSPLTEEEFDWFLQMFDERERLRQSDRDEYDDYVITDKEMDWYLRMFESRARLRFQNDAEDSNWYLKMSAARNEARSRKLKFPSSPWPAGRIKDWKHTQESKGLNWYDVMGIQRQQLRYEAAILQGDGKCKA